MQAVEKICARPEIAADLPMFRGLDDQQLQGLLDRSQTTRYCAGERIFRAGDAADRFLILRRGRVKLRRFSGNGQEVALHIAAPPQMIGCKALTTPGSVYPADAVALDEVHALSFRRDPFIEAAGQCPGVFFELLVNLHQRMSQILTIQAAKFEPVQQRIATLLLQQALPRDAELEEWPRRPIREVRLTKSLIASMAGAATETAIRVLSKWSKAGWIESKRARISLKDPAMIYAVSQGMARLEAAAG